MRHIAVSVLVLATTVPSAAIGQDVEQYRNRLRSMRDTYAAARAAADSADRVIANRLRVDTVMTGNLLILVPSDRSGPLRRGAHNAWRIISAALGPDTVLLDRVAFFFPTIGVRSGRLEIEDREMRPIRVQSGRAADYTAQIISWVSTVISENADSTLTTWLVRSIPVTDDAPDLSAVRGEFVTSPSFLTQECRAGTLRSCRLALGLDTVGNPATEWYDARGRAELVAGWPGLVRRDFEARDVCVDRGWDQVCMAILEATGPGIPPPLSVAARVSLMEFALRRGGDGAYRALGSPGRARPPADVLGRVAGIPTDSLLREWRAAVLATTSRSVTPSLAGGLTGLVWIGLLLGAALANRPWR